MAVEVFIHKMSEHMQTARILRWLAKEGDPVQQHQVIIEVETDKVTAEFEAPATGVLKGVRMGVVDGAEVKVGETIAFIAEADEQVPTLPPLSTNESMTTDVAASPSPPVAPEPAESGPVKATPVARRVAKDLGVDLHRVKGTGPGGRVTEADVRASALTAPAPAASVSQVEDQADNWVELTAAQRITGQRMMKSLQTAPQFTLTLHADMTNALWLREALTDRIVAESGERPSVTAILVKVVAEALKNHPRANASFEIGRIRLHKRINIGVATGSDAGLVVPVVKDADRKAISEIVQEINSFQAKVKQMRFGANELEGGTFTISNLGMFGIEQFNAIIDSPQSAILAVGRVVKTPVGTDSDAIVLRPMMSLTLTVDHRVMDGIQGARFLSEIKARLEKPFFLM
ncbi:MAG: 2-oxo acid dehydrogenase subunit E2 [Chloroflexi bacterium]|nr:2-oxo acid dehydrogenase subunit E2 [Chloroflexota bacterium]